jgi:hypothetical protein
VSIESDIVDKIVSTVESVPGINYVKFDEIKLAIEDFSSHELPAVQIWDNGQVIKHERQRIQVDWNLSLELIMKTDAIKGVVDQKILFEKRREIQLVLWDRPNLDIPGVVHMIYTGNISDLHLLRPYYIARIDFSVRYYDQLTGTC